MPDNDGGEVPLDEAHSLMLQQGMAEGVQETDARHAHQHTNRWYAVHEELLRRREEDGATMHPLCGSCRRDVGRGEVPRYSLAAG